MSLDDDTDAIADVEEKNGHARHPGRSTREVFYRDLGLE